MINFDDKKSKGTHWVSLFMDRNTAVYLDSSGADCIPKEVLNKTKDKSITNNIFRMQDNDSVMCGFYYIAFIEYMLARKVLLNYTIFFSPNDYKKNNKITLKTNMSGLDFRFKRCIWNK